MKKLLARLLCAPFLLIWFALGWRPVGKLPEANKFVVIGAPHTSNWDYFIFLIIACYFGIKPTVLVRHTIMPGPFGVFVRAMGGVPVDRTSSHNLVDQVVEMFHQHDRFILVLSPEGTISKTDHWKSGFYHIALGAQVPILLAFLDFDNKRGGLGPLFTPTGDIEADMATIRDFYTANASGKYPDSASTIQVRPNEKANEHTR